MHELWTSIVALAAILGSPALSWSQDEAAPPAPPLTLYVVGYAHLDTQWRWTYPQTIREFLAHTLRDNFALFEQHPGYVFNFTGSRRYQMFREYFPEDYARLKEYVAEGRWFPCGSSVDENDTNIPAGESLVRNVLYGNRFFRRELGVASEEYMLPDCFGFTAAVPSVLAHCGIEGFSTQKLTWGSVVGIPFNLGVWVGPDGRSVIAALNPGAYDSDIQENLATSETWKKRIEADGQGSGVFADLRYYGTGDVGGAPREASVAKLEESMETDGPVRVIGGPADELFRALTPEQVAKLPRYQGELELTGHSAGSLTSQAAMKRWNRKNELLADAAERAAALAWWLGGCEYPAQKIEAAWTLVLGSQMHDIVSGTALAKGYEYAWNDECLAANQFAAVLEDSVSVVAGQLDTRCDDLGFPLVVFNPLSTEREDVVEAELPVHVSVPPGVCVTGPDGKSVPAQILEGTGEHQRIAFLARVPSVGFAVFVAHLLDKEAPVQSPLRVEERRLENERYLVKLDENGDLASIQDKRAQRELLSAPARLGLHYENPVNWPAWNQDWSDRQQPAREFVGGPARFRVVERGPARVAVEVMRALGGSTFVQRIRLAAGGERVEVDADIAWTARERSLRAAFPLTVRNPLATYDLQTGVLERGNASEKQYEYGFLQWFDLTDARGDYGVTVMSDCKYAADKPDDSTVRLTLLHTPGTHGGYHDQGTQDLGRQRVLYALAGHEGDWRAGHSALEAARLNQPLLAFHATSHEGLLGRSFAFVRASGGDVTIQALKKAEDSDELIVRLRELSGRRTDGVHLAFARPLRSAREVDGQERELGPATVRAGELVAGIDGFGLRAFAMGLGEPPAKAARPEGAPLPLPFDADVVSTNPNRGDGAMDAEGRTLPAEQLPATITAGEALFTLGPTAEGAKNALTCRGQVLALPADGRFERLHLLAACDAPGQGLDAALQVDGQSVPIHVGSWTGFVGQWDHRLWQGDEPELAYGWSNALAGIEPGFVGSDTVAWFASHCHEKTGDAYYRYAYLYSCTVALPPGAREIRLPDDARIKVLAATAVSSGGERAVAAQPLFDTLADHVQDAPRLVPEAGSFADSVELAIEPRLYWRPGAIRFTLDGSEPSASSPAYTGPFFVDRPTTIRTAVVDADGNFGPSVSGRLEVHDITPPRLVQVAATYGSPLVRLSFSEPLAEPAYGAGGYALEPALEVRAARRGGDAREVVLELAAPPELERAYRLRIAGVADASPAHNALPAAEVELKVRGPVFTLAEVTPAQMGTEIKDVPDLPVAGKDAWTLNLFVRLEQQPEDRTLIAGFGSCEQSANGACRFLAKFPNGIHFWSHNCDVPGRTPFDLGRWQMLTATYDGRVARLYQDGKLLGERELELVDDRNAVQLAPLDPWDGTRRFAGQIQQLTIWRDALGEEALRSLLSSRPAR